MPKFEVQLMYTKTANMTIEVRAKDEDVANDKVQQMISDLNYDYEAIAKKYKTEWTEDEEDITIDSVDEL